MWKRRNVSAGRDPFCFSSLTCIPSHLRHIRTAILFLLSSHVNDCCVSEHASYITHLNCLLCSFRSCSILFCLIPNTSPPPPPTPPPLLPPDFCWILDLSDLSPDFDNGAPLGAVCVFCARRELSEELNVEIGRAESGGGFVRFDAVLAATWCCG